ncbi:putative MFS family arabinose efflux permease [Roseimicrobium gellanilyticum]|uniref:Putative MFS family arabinose efflux permease n=1 Tax=Roseimicrobium gellanilyticum TaxID=748857 RepID=A0A366HS84_9BACT|nr:MFS transporter [Roseimicrobium gellanilyticum]RBP45784.1 putative MFS family arabinose efflux permease [Roseimicrobium gellanilyticum]
MPAPESPLPRNTRLFVWFRLLFNCRFYYPVYTVLFLDFGLNLEQFALLNVVWAVSIVLLEVPSGALADVLGRRNMVVLAAVLMVVEMLVFAMLPVGGPWVFWVFIVNRVISGAAEAMASGADEALAYDSIPASEQSTVWPRVMARLSRWMALGFIVSSLIGAFVYDASSVNRALSFIGWEHADLAKQITLKFPIYLCVLTALLCLLVTLAMREPQERVGTVHATFRDNMRASMRGIREAGAWIWRTPAPLLLMTLGFLLDSIVRLFYTVSSNYYRLIGLPEASFGVISVLSSLAAFFTTHWMEWLVRHRSSKFNFALVIAMVAWGLVVLANPLPGWWGILAIAPLLLSMRFFQFFLSHYLNEVTSSERRATVLSFRGMTMNLAYGAVTLLFGWQTAFLSGRLGVGSEDSRVFAAALKWWPCWFAGTMVAYVLFRAWRLRKLEASVRGTDGPDKA